MVGNRGELGTGEGVKIITRVVMVRPLRATFIAYMSVVMRVTKPLPMLVWLRLLSSGWSSWVTKWLPVYEVVTADLMLEWVKKTATRLVRERRRGYKEAWVTKWLPGQSRTYI